mmetsp:Transcript_16077/g.24231  ORF Transcript_16077/g.24231 Transcript_16077/m.24231 type:complete len:317 (-) Transcript_16077:184-1134(-)
MHIPSPIVVLFTLQSISALLIEDVYVPLDCHSHASPSDHLLIEFTVKQSNGEVIQPAYKKPGNLFHVLLEQSDLPVHRALKGMCENGTRVMSWENGHDLNLAPLPVSKYALQNLEESITVEISVQHITPQSDYQVFSLFKMGNFTEVMTMIDEHRGVNAVDEWGSTLLMQATKKGNLPVVAALLNTRMPKVDVNMAKANGFTAIFYAIELHSTNILKALLRRGANPNVALTQKDAVGSTPLHFACMLEKSKHAELLLEYGADVMAVNEHGQYPLQLLPRDTVTSTKLYFKRMFEDALARKEKEWQASRGQAIRNDL